ncbi:hypothetical protein M0R45_009208 [Rubus argutus]|uniref:Uncharacterized protein n=1 Tax=Rubus argutus TaxID=59490 RepID=A0AAW1Y6D6_RUBAR
MSALESGPLLLKKVPTLSIVLTIWRSVSKIQKVLSGFEEKVAIGCIPSGTSEYMFLLGTSILDNLLLWEGSEQLHNFMFFPVMECLLATARNGFGILFMQANK